ncbi:unnamed protein product [Cochlearia groenlandica]
MGRSGKRDVVSWSAMMACFTNNGKEHDTIELFVSSLELGLVPNDYCYTAVIRACSNPEKRLGCSWTWFRDVPTSDLCSLNKQSYYENFQVLYYDKLKPLLTKLIAKPMRHQLYMHEIPVNFLTVDGGTKDDLKLLTLKIYAFWFYSEDDPLFLRIKALDGVRSRLAQSFENN